MVQGSFLVHIREQSQIHICSLGPHSLGIIFALKVKACGGKSIFSPFLLAGYVVTPVDGGQ